MRSNTSASRCTGRRWASRLRLTRPASSSTFRCLETAWTVTSYGAASSLTVASPTASRATMSRRVGSASAENTRESGSAATSSSFLLNLSVDEDARGTRRPLSTVRLEKLSDAGREAGVVEDQTVVVDGELERPVPLVAVLPPSGRQPLVGLVDPGHSQIGDVDP